VYGLLRESGLTRFYEFRRGRGLPPPEPHGDLLQFDGLLAGGVVPAGDGLVSVAVDIQGVHCAGCVWILETLFRRHPAGVDLRINPALGTAEIVWAPARGDLREWLAEAERFGYRFGRAGKPAVPRSRSLLIRLGISTAAAANVMIFSLCYYFGLAPAEGALYGLLGWLSLALTTVTLVAGGWVFLRTAVRGLRRGLVHLDLPIATGILLAYTGSVFAFLRQGPEAAYFDTVSIFITLMLVGRWLEERVLERNRHALLADGGIDHLYTRRYREGLLETIPASRVEAGDEIWIVPGDVVPADGVVTGNEGSISLAWITGESESSAVSEGDAVPAGAANDGDRTLHLVASAGSSSSRLASLLASPLPRDPGDGTGWWRRVSTVYVALVFLLAAGGFLAWVGQGVDRALEVTVAILVVACPCALGLATPMAHELMHLALRRRGVLLRRNEFLDRALAVRRVLFDKTGTLTLGSLELTPASRSVLETLGAEDRLALSTLAAQSNHPTARAVRDALGEGALAVAPAPVREIPGHGVETEIGAHLYRLGRGRFARNETDRGSGSEPDSRATVFTVDGVERARMELTECVKEDAREEIEALGRAGYEIHLLSGDAPARVATVAGALGIPPGRTGAGMTPEEKAARVAELDRGDALMVGDGLNDGPALAAATCSATPTLDHPALPDRSDFVFLGEEIGAVRRALFSARALRRVVRGNLIVAAAYNAAALTLCYAGLVTPVVAAILMPVSSVTLVLLTTWRLTGGRLAWMS